MSSDLLAILFGLASSVSWGAGDFTGGLATKRSSVYGVVIVSQMVGAGLILGLALGLGEVFPAPASLFFGVLGGVAGVIGLVALYRGLAEGNMAVVAPMAAAIAAALPVLFGLILEGWPTLLQVLGFGVALAAVWLLAQDGEQTRIRLADLRLPLIAGAGFGFFFIFIDQASAEAVFWPLLAARLGSITLLILLVLIRRQRPTPARSHLPLIALTGVFDTGGNAFYALAAQTGRLDISAILSSLYPATTVLLAAVVLREKVGRRQRVGLVAALVALVLIAG